MLYPSVMKTIVLAANGEGFGHASRMVSLVQSLDGRYRLVLFAPATIQTFLHEKLDGRTMQPLRMYTIPCLEMAKQGDRIMYWRTIKNNLPTLLTVRTTLAKIRAQLKYEKADALISDFEPFSTWAAKALNIPVLQLNHPGVVLRSNSIQIDALLAKFTAFLMMGVYTKRLLVSFYDGDIGPLIREEIRRQKVVEGESILVCIKKEYRKQVLSALTKIGVGNFLVYPDPANTKSYEEALASCRAVITSAGHQTLSECIYLGKPVFALPQRGQYEQRLNAKWLESSGCGMRGGMRYLTDQLMRFVKNIEMKVCPGPVKFPWISIKKDDWTERLVLRIIDFIECNPSLRIIPLDAQLLDSWLRRTTDEASGRKIV